MKKDKNGAIKNGARPHFQTERWTRQLQNGAWHHFRIARSEATWQSLKKRQKDEHREVNEYAL
jgi:hypothetical protein